MNDVNNAESLSPETRRLLETIPMDFHPAVRLVTVHGSRGPAGGWRTDSDLDLSLIADTTGIHGERLDSLLREVLAAARESFKCPVELDFAAVNDINSCGLACFACDAYEDLDCSQERTGCLGVFKKGKGFGGHVPPIIEIKKMFPFAVVWRRPS